MDKKKFLEDWVGGVNSFGQREKFKKAQGSSLSDYERVFVNGGGIALHKKGDRNTKVFVEDENHNMYSVTVMNTRLDQLKNGLLDAGYILSAA